MELNSLVFPSPESSYSYTSLPGEILFIPRGEMINGKTDFDVPLKDKTRTHIPCLFLPYARGSSKLLLYFHGNAEDVGLAYDLLDHLRNSLTVFSI